MASLFSSCFGCMRKHPASKTTVRPAETVDHPPVPVSNPLCPQRDVVVLPPVLEIHTTVPKRLVRMHTATPESAEERAIYRYNCPICFRYFSRKVGPTTFL